MHTSRPSGRHGERDHPGEEFPEHVCSMTDRKYSDYMGANDPEHAHRLAACWNAFLQAETTEIERIDDGLSDMNDLLLAGGGWHVLQHQQALP